MKMKKIFLTIVLMFSFYSNAQISLQQDSSDINWMKIENEYFEIVYPEHTVKQAQYIRIARRT